MTKTIVKSIRLTPEEIAWALYACDQLKSDFPSTPNGAIKALFYVGMNSILGARWTTENPPDDCVARASETRQPISPRTVRGAADGQPAAGRFSGINPPLADDHSRQIWDMLVNEHLSPLDQMEDGDHIAELTAQILSRYAWARLTSEEQARVHEVLAGMKGATK